MSLAEARARREERRINESIDRMIEHRLKGAQLAAPISAHAKVKLRDILKKYAKSAHPFDECVRDNKKRFGPGRVEAVCATLKDTIRGNKNWRGKGNAKDKGTAGLAEGASLTIDGDVLLALNAISEVDLMEIFLEARALEEHGTVEATALLSVSGTAELTSWGAR